MPDITRCITSFAEFDRLPDFLKKEYVNTIQTTYFVGLKDIYLSMDCPMAPGTFEGYLNKHNVFGNRTCARMKTNPVWPFFLAGLATTDGQMIDQLDAKPAPPKRDPAHLEITGGPKPLLDILSLLFSSPEILDASSYKITIQEMTAQ